MKSRNIQIAVASVLAAGLSMGAQASTYSATQDTYVYEFFGNQGSPTGDSGGILVWNHESNHGGQGLLQIDSSWTSDAALSGAYTATLNLYSSCTAGGFIGACAGDGGTVTNTDVVLQGSAWTEGDAALGWGDISQSSLPSSSFTQSSNVDGWISVDVTDMIAYMLDNNTDYGFALTQEAYGVVRTSGSVATSSFCDSESSGGACALGDFSPYLEITPSAVPIPAAAWLFGSGLLGLVGIARRESSVASI